jgi:uncharacterized LabA/DUF88 family protein
MSPTDSSKIALFIDGFNLHATAKKLGFGVDYKRLLKEFQSRGTLLRAYYYTVILGDQDYPSVRSLIDWLDYNGYTVVTKTTNEFTDAGGRHRVKDSTNIELAVHAMQLAEHVDQIVLFSGNGDFRSLVEAVQRRLLAVQVGQLALKLDQRMIGTGDVTRAARPGAHADRGLDHGADHLRVLPHGEVVVGAPDDDAARAGRRVPDGVGIAPGDAFKVREHAIAPLIPQLRNRVREEPVVAHEPDS